MSDHIDKLREAVRRRGERPPEELFREMVERGAIDEDGNVLLKSPITTPPPRCRHRDFWVIACPGVVGQVYWYYRCGAIKLTSKDKPKWTRPVGPDGVNPAMKEDQSR